MTLPPSGYHARAVTFGCMAKGKGVSSRASLLISVKVLVGNAVSFGHHAKATWCNVPNFPLKRHLVLLYESDLIKALK
jgi:hypothetical protein